MPLSPGDPAPWISAPTPFNPEFGFAALGGRYTVLLMCEGAHEPAVRSALQTFAAASLPRDDYRYKTFFVTNRSEDVADPLVGAVAPDQRVFLDPARTMARAFAAVAEGRIVPHWLVLDPQLRVVGVGGLGAIGALVDLIRRLPRAEAHLGSDPWAPVLLIPNVLEPQLCSELIAAYRAGTPEASGFMDQKGARTVQVLDPETKRRSDVTLEPGRLREALRTRIASRIAPMIARAFMFEVTRVERFIVACYDASDRGFFKMHRDNTTAGTAHRRFAVTINLNAEDFDGGELTFPEYGGRRYKAPTGGAIVFSCALMHQAEPVTRGTRYATLPFLYDEAGARIRAGANAALAPGVPRYQPGADDLLFPARATQAA